MGNFIWQVKPFARFRQTVAFLVGPFQEGLFANNQSENLIKKGHTEFNLSCAHRGSLITTNIHLIWIGGFIFFGASPRSLSMVRLILPSNFLFLFVIHDTYKFP